MINSSNDSRTMEVLLVEDNPGDIELTLEAFQDTKILNHINVVRDGEEALEFLYQRGSYRNAVRPDIILLDLNMPRKGGKEVLAIIKEDETLKDIPVIILTSSEAEQDVITSYKLHANAYIAKPMDFSQFQHVMEVLKSFWLSVVKLPPEQKK